MLDPEILELTVRQAREAIRDEGDRSRAGAQLCEDPGVKQPSADLERLKEKFSFLSDYSDEFIKSMGVDVLIKAEAASEKLSRYNKDKKAEDKLFQNREKMASIQVKEGQDNRLDVLHPARALPGATCTAAKLWLHARSVMGSGGHPALATYDMAAIGLGGCVSAKGWVELHNPSSPSISIKMFSMGGCTSKASKDEEFPDLEDISELKAAVRVLRGAMAFVHPWNRSIDALENFFIQNSFCFKDLAGMERQTVLLTQFVDYVLVENACRWRGMEPFLSTRDLRNTWSDFVSQKGVAFKKKGGAGQDRPHQQGGYRNNELPSQRLGVPAFLFNDNICVNWNLGKCLRPPGDCKSKKGSILRHVCNHRPDISKPHIICEKSHMAYLFHK